jgi:hypothetical protein
MELKNGVNNSETQEQRHVGAIPNILRLIWPSSRSTKQAEKVFMLVLGTMATRSNKGIKKMSDRTSQYIFTKFSM